MILERAHTELGWPERQAILDPQDEAASVSVRALRDNVERALRLRPDVRSVSVGILPTSRGGTEAPLALVCEFGGPVSEATLLEAHRLAWNYSRTNLLVTAEPGLIRAWTCCERPAVDRFGAEVEGGSTMSDLVVAEAHGEAWTAGPAADLHWAELATGQLFRRHAGRFEEANRAHVTLLRNLLAVRERLTALGLDRHYTHRLLARLIFVQFLFDRKDSEGNAAIDEGQLRAWHFAEHLEGEHASVADVLRSPADTYNLFRRLDVAFGGDLFDAEELVEEEARVTAAHLELLAQFVRGDADFRTGQLSLWRAYAFDVIPLDLLSSVYETFVEQESAVGVHYTPTHVADLVLDHVLPWEGDQWDLRVLDPACGSGIFLVKAFQRLVHRWRAAHPDRPRPRASDLRRLLSENLVGVDIDEEAVRVAAFSLYLAMCDQIEPRYVLSENGIFPSLRGRTLHAVDFFDESTPGIRTCDDGGTYDLAVGNPPYGSGSLSAKGREWAEAWDWPTVGTEGGTAFVGKAGKLVQEGGQVAVVQAAPVVLYNSSGPARRVQRAILGEAFRVEGVTLLPPRLRLFRGVDYPACVLYLRSEAPDDRPFPYERIRRQWWARDAQIDDRIRFVRDPSNVHWIRPSDVLRDDEPWAWAAYTWGGPRDIALIRHLRQSFPTLASLRGDDVHILEGLKSGRTRERTELLGRKWLGGTSFPGPPLQPIEGYQQSEIPDVWAGNHSTSTAAFELPQLLVKKSWVQEAGRFQARRVVGEAVVPSKAFDSVSGPEPVVAAAEVAYNSAVGTYFLFLTSGRLATNRPEPKLGQLREVPLPVVEGGRDYEVPRTLAELDDLAFGLYGLVGAERTLVEDAVRYTIDDFKGTERRGRVPTDRGGGVEPDLAAYGEAFSRVAGATYGDRGRVALRVLADEGSSLPARMVSLTVGPSVKNGFSVETVEAPVLRSRLASAYRQAREAGGDTFRVARVYEAVAIEGEPHVILTIVKPDEVRYWTRSEGIRDADRFAVEVATWVAGRPTELALVSGE